MSKQGRSILWLFLEPYELGVKQEDVDLYFKFKILALIDERMRQLGTEEVELLPTPLIFSKKITEACPPCA